MADETSVQAAVNNLKLYKSSQEVEAVARVANDLASVIIGPDGVDVKIGELQDSISTVSYNTLVNTNNINDLNSSVNYFMSNTEGEMATMWETASTMQTTISATKFSLSSLYSDVGDMDVKFTGQMNGVKNDLSSVQSSSAVNTADIAALKTTGSTTTGAVATLQSDMTTAKSNITSLQGSVGTLQTSVGTVTSTVSTLTTDMTAAKGNITTLQGNVTTLQSTSSTNTSNISALTTRANGVDTSISTINGNVSALQTASTTTNSNLAALRTSVATTLGMTAPAYTLSGPVMITNLGRIATQIGAADLTWAVGETKNAYQIGVDVATTSNYEVHRVKIIPSSGTAANYTEFKIICTPGGVVGVTRTIGDAYTVDVLNGWVRITNVNLLSTRTARLVRTKEF